MHEPDQVVLLKMPPVRVHWLKVQTENTNKEAAKFTFPRVYTALHKCVISG